MHSKTNSKNSSNYRALKIHASHSFLLSCGGEREIHAGCACIICREKKEIKCNNRDVNVTEIECEVKRGKKWKKFFHNHK